MIAETSTKATTPEATAQPTTTITTTPTTSTATHAGKWQLTPDSNLKTKLKLYIGIVFNFISSSSTISRM